MLILFEKALSVVFQLFGLPDCGCVSRRQRLKRFMRRLWYNLGA